jgi:hypothetical protein
MPLKHKTETAYIAVLAAVIALAGFGLALLPPYPAGVLPWLMVWVISLLYPLVLLGTFRKNRADYELRLLHWFPFAMLTLWALAQGIGMVQPVALAIYRWLTVFWSIPLVLLGLLLLSLFCMQVIRRQSSRLSIIGGVLVLFLATGSIVACVRSPENTGADITGSGSTILSSSSKMSSRASSQSVSSRSSSRQSTQTSLGAFQSSRRSERMQSRSSVSSSRSSVSSRSSSRSSRRSSASSVSSVPPKLPRSGPAEIGFVIFLLALYTGVLHARAKKRI